MAMNYNGMQGQKGNMTVIIGMLLLLSHFSQVQLFAKLWTVARQAPLP